MSDWPEAEYGPRELVETARKGRERGALRAGEREIADLRPRRGSGLAGSERRGPGRACSSPGLEPLLGGNASCGWGRGHGFFSSLREKSAVTLHHFKLMPVGFEMESRWSGGLVQLAQLRVHGQ